MDKVQLYFEQLKEKLAYTYFISMGDKGMTSNDLLRTKADVENYFWCFYCILSKNRAKKGHIISNLLTESEVITGKSPEDLGLDVLASLSLSQRIHQGLSLRFPCNNFTLD